MKLDEPYRSGFKMVHNCSKLINISFENLLSKNVQLRCCVSTNPKHASIMSATLDYDSMMMFLKLSNELTRMRAKPQVGVSKFRILQVDTDLSSR